MWTMEVASLVPMTSLREAHAFGFTLALINQYKEHFPYMNDDDDDDAVTSVSVFT